MNIFSIFKKKITHTHVYNMRKMQTSITFMPTALKQAGGFWSSGVYDGYFRVRTGYRELCECGHEGKFFYEGSKEKRSANLGELFELDAASEIFMRLSHNGGQCYMTTSKPQSNPDYYTEKYERERIKVLETKIKIQKEFNQALTMA